MEALTNNKTSFNDFWSDIYILREMLQCFEVMEVSKYKMSILVVCLHCEVKDVCFVMTSMINLDAWDISLHLPFKTTASSWKYEIFILIGILPPFFEI